MGLRGPRINALIGTLNSANASSRESKTHGNASPGTTTRGRGYLILLCF